MKTPIILFTISLMIISSCSQSSENKKSSSSGSQTENPLLNEAKTIVIFDSIRNYIAEAEIEMEAIPEDRKNMLKKIALYIKTKKHSSEPVNLVFICTHNSRRSHLSQIWAHTAAHYYGVAEGISTFSGGTEATAFNPRAVAAIERAGFRVENSGGDNPKYKVSFAENAEPMVCFSKVYTDPSNPQENFAAVMTCSEADKTCPNIPGASLRVPLTYEDPKVADNTPEETARYDERCKQIATEMLYLMLQVK